MKRAYSDEELRQILGADLSDSRLIGQKIQSAYDEIRERADRQRQGVREGGNRRKDGAGRGRLALRRAAAGFGVTAAVMALAVIFCAANPSLAEELPVVGGIFGKLRGLFVYSGIPEEEIVSLRGEETAVDTPESGENGDTADGQDADGAQGQTGTAEPGEMGEDGLQDEKSESDRPQYQAADQGLTVTLAEYYASNQSIQIGVRVESETPFPEFAFMQDEPHRQILTVWTEERYSFRDAGDELVSGGRQIEGRLMNEHTFEGVMRIDYDSIRVDSRKYDRACEEGEAVAAARGETFEGITVTEENYDDWFGQYELPGNFRMELAITGFKGYVYSGNYKAAGRWEFTEPIEITRDVNGGSEICVDETNGAGWGLKSVEVSPGEVTVHVISPENESGWAVVLDKDGRPLVRGVNADQFGAYGRDLSELTVYVCDFETWTDLKSEAYRAGGESGEMDEALYRRLLEEQAQYRKVLRP